MDLAASSGVPKPSVFIVSTLLARERLIVLCEERFEGARPRSWRCRRRGWALVSPVLFDDLRW